MNQKSNKLTVPDLISVGVFTALYFVLVTVATFACALLPGVGNILLPAVAALISGSVYMLLAAKLQKFGGITIMGLVMGLFFFVSGHLCCRSSPTLICGVARDVGGGVAAELNRRRRKRKRTSSRRPTDVPYRFVFRLRYVRPVPVPVPVRYVSSVGSVTYVIPNLNDLLTPYRRPPTGRPVRPTPRTPYTYRVSHVPTDHEPTELPVSYVVRRTCTYVVL